MPQDFLSASLAAFVADPSGIALLFLTAHFFTAALTGLRGGVRPFYWSLMENAGIEVDRRLNREGKPVSELSLRGFVAVAVMGGMSLVVGIAVHKLSQYTYGWLATLIFLSMSLSAMGPVLLIRRVSLALGGKDMKKAASLMQPYLREDISHLDSYALSRKALELAAWRLSQFFVAPLFWFLLTGVRGLALYVTFAAVYEAFGGNDPRHIVFGAWARAIERVINYVPARITALALALAALFVSKGNPLRTVKTMATESAKYRGLNKGVLFAACAGALGITLGGSIKHNNGTVEHGWVGPAGGSAQVSVQDLQRGVMLHFIAFLIVFGLLGFAKAQGF